MIYEQAKEIAIMVGRKLQPYCDKVNIAGSVRRHKSECHDIELCVLPGRIVVHRQTLFDKGAAVEVVNPQFFEAVKFLGKIIKGSPHGRMMQVELHEEHLMLDLFMPDEADYFRQLAIRTGSREYSQKVIAAGWLKIGWAGSDQGLRKQSECIRYEKPDGKHEWRCISKNPTLPPWWKSEEEFFQWIKTPYIKPIHR